MRYIAGLFFLLSQVFSSFAQVWGEADPDLPLAREAALLRSRVANP